MKLKKGRGWRKTNDIRLHLDQNGIMNERRWYSGWQSLTDNSRCAPNIVQTHSSFTLSLVDTSEIPHLRKILDWVKFGGNVCISHEYFTQWWFTLSSMKNYNKLIFVILADSVDIFSNKGKTVTLLTSFAFCRSSSMTTRWQMRLTRGFLLYRWTLNAFADGRGKRRTEG